MINTNFNNTQHGARLAMQNYIITTSERVKNTKEYQQICDIVFKLMEGGVTFAAKGYCISMSDIIYTLLKQVNIPCKMVECQLAITDANSGISVVGFSQLKDDPNRTDTHVVVVTQTEVPMVIDVSIAHLMPHNIQGVIDEANILDDRGIFANIKHQYVSLTYQEKPKYNIPLLHQTSIVDRIKTDMEIFKSLRILRTIIIIALCISTINAARGFYDFYQTYVSSDSIASKLIELEKDIHELIHVETIEKLNK